MMPYRVAIHLVPTPLWRMNLRKGRVIPVGRWKKIRTELIDKNGLVCQTCGKVERDRKRLSVHEEWEYLTNQTPAVARLAGLKISCWHCHMIGHFGALKNMVASGEVPQRAIEDTIEHFCRLNDVGREEFIEHLAQAKVEWMVRNKLKWEFDWGEYTELVKETALRQERLRRQPKTSRPVKNIVSSVFVATMSSIPASPGSLVPVSRIIGVAGKHGFSK